MPNDGHEVLFKWPHPEPKEVVLSGAFNNWDRTFHLTKGSDGFSGTVVVPWNSKTTYKFIVDGTWMLLDDQPTELDHDGNMNNVYTAPPDPSPTSSTPLTSTVNSDTTKDSSESQSAQQPNGKHVAPALPSRPASTSSFPQLVSDLADTVAARDGTSSALGYVASGLGAAIHNVVGLDPINSDQIAIPTPLPTAATVRSEFVVPTNAVSETPLSAQDHASTAPALAADDNANHEPNLAVEMGQVAPDVPVTIVPVNAPENNTATPEPSASLPAPIAGVANPELQIKDNQPSTHEIVPTINGNDSNAAAVNTEVNEGETRVLGAVAAAPGSEPTAGGNISEFLGKPAEQHNLAKEVEKGQKEPEEPLKAIGNGVHAATTSPLTESASKSLQPVEIPETKDSSPNVKPVLVPAPNTTPIAIASDQDESPHNKALNTLQVNTPDSGLNPASVLVPEEVPEGRSIDAFGPVHEQIETTEKPENVKEIPLDKAPAKYTDSALQPPTTLGDVTTGASESEAKQGTLEKPAENVHAPEHANKTPAPGVTKSQINGHTEEKSQPERPSTPIKAPIAKEAFPSSGGLPSPSASPSSSKTGTGATRKKRQSFFGKLKHLFDHDKEKEKVKVKK